MTIGRHWGKREAVPEQKGEANVEPRSVLVEDRRSGAIHSQPMSDTIWWCETHQAPGPYRSNGGPTPRACYPMLFDASSPIDACLMVERRMEDRAFRDDH